MKIGLIQLCVSDDPGANLPLTRDFVASAAGQGAALIATPECTNLLSPDRNHMRQMLHPEASDPTLAALRQDAARLGLWLLIGSLALLAEDSQRFVNRSFLIGPDGRIAARYDKIHMFDVTISDTESYRESASYCAGDRAVLAQGPAPIGLSICYDLRFPVLYQALAQAGAQILTVPSAFNDTTGAAHWHVLLRARAIETGCFVLAPAQTGTHPAPSSPDRPARRSYGHSLAVNPWGEIIADAGEEVGATVLTLDLADVGAARSRIPSLSHSRGFAGP
ncbi:MAG: carbon-nitrogen hydrolase family protein [Paracoccus sp. (in: a-proteobacteria)]|nr:carbon-nitrogen hydrolase family protein [Paracoccus sp. (in: a-proteobacteria)]